MSSLPDGFTDFSANGPDFVPFFESPIFESPFFESTVPRSDSVKALLDVAGEGGGDDDSDAAGRDISSSPCDPAPVSLLTFGVCTTPDLDAFTEPCRIDCNEEGDGGDPGGGGGAVSTSVDDESFAGTAFVVFEA